MTAAPVHYREFRMSDLDALVPLWRASFEHGVGIVDPHPLEEQRQYFLDEVLPTYAVRVATRGERLVGFIAASPEVVAQLYVCVDDLRLGVGTRLLRWAQERSSGSLWLFTFACNEHAQAFYEKHGFVVTDRGFEEAWQLADLRYEWVRP